MPHTGSIAVMPPPIDSANSKPWGGKATARGWRGDRERQPERAQNSEPLVHHGVSRPPPSASPSDPTLEKFLQGPGQRYPGFHCLTVSRLVPDALVGPLGSSFKAARSIGLVARARERLRRFAEHRSCLLALALSLAQNPPSLPHRPGPQPTLPHARDALRFGDERACPIQLAGARTGRRRTREVSHRARLA